MGDLPRFMPCRLAGDDVTVAHGRHRRGHFSRYRRRRAVADRHFGGTPSIAMAFLDAGRIEVVTGVNLAMLMKFYQQGRAEGDFEAGIQQALSRLLVSPAFLFRVETAPRSGA